MTIPVDRPSTSLILDTYGDVGVIHLVSYPLGIQLASSVQSLPSARLLLRCRDFAMVGLQLMRLRFGLNSRLGCPSSFNMHEGR